MAPGWATSSSATSASVVSRSSATETALWSAEHVTFAESITPAAIMSPYSSVSALSPCPRGRLRTFSTTADPSWPALAAIPRSGSGRSLCTTSAPSARSPEPLERRVLEPHATVLGDHLGAGQRGDVLEVVEPPVPEAGRAHRDGRERPVHGVGHEHAESGAIDVLGDHDQRPLGPHRQ